MEASEILRRWFESCVRPTRHPLWISAAASEAVRGRPRLLLELTSRGLEDADALARRRALTHYATCAIAHALATLNLNHESLHALLSSLDFLRHPHTLIHRPLPKEVREALLLLIDQEYDPTPQWDRIVEEANHRFKEGLRHLSETIKVEPPPGALQTAVTSYFEEEGPWWGVRLHLEEHLVNILPPYLLLPDLSAGLLLREAARLLLPQSFHETMEAQEVANTLARILLPSSLRSFWNRCRWGGTPPAPIHADTIDPLPHLVEQLHRHQCFGILLRRLEQLHQLVEYPPAGSLTVLITEQLEAAQEDAASKLQEPTMHLLLSQLARNPTISERGLARATGLARGTIRRALDILKSVANLRIIGEINYPKVGLVPLLLLVSKSSVVQPSNDVKGLARRLESFPYCLGLLRMVGGDAISSILVLPPEAVQLLQKRLTSWASRNRLFLLLAPVHQYGWGWNASWWSRIPLAEWQLIARSRLRVSPPPNTIHGEITYSGPSDSLSVEALQVLVALEENPLLSVRRLAQACHLSSSASWNHRRRLLPAILTPRLHLQPRPLCEALILSIAAPQDGDTPQEELISLLRLLPAYQIWRLGEPLASPTDLPAPTLLVATALPKGGAVPLAHSLPNALKARGAHSGLLHIAKSLLPRIHGLPIALYDNTKRRWMATPRLLDQLLPK